MTTVAEALTRRKASRRAAKEQMWPCGRRQVPRQDQHAHRRHKHTFRHNNYITLPPPNNKKKRNSSVPNVLFLNKNAYRGLKRSVLRSKSLFCFNHVWVLLLPNTDIHTYQGNEDTKTPRTPTTSGKHLMWPITRL